MEERRRVLVLIAFLLLPFLASCSQHAGKKPTFDLHDFQIVAEHGEYGVTYRGKGVLSIKEPEFNKERYLVCLHRKQVYDMGGAQEVEDSEYIALILDGVGKVETYDYVDKSDMTKKASGPRYEWSIVGYQELAPSDLTVAQPLATKTVAPPPLPPSIEPTSQVPVVSPDTSSRGEEVEQLPTAQLAMLPGWDKWSGKRNPVPNNKASIAEGKGIFNRNCASCHGETGLGDGPAGAALDPKPRNLTLGKFKFGSEPWQVMRTVWEGVPETGMAGWDGRMDEEDAWTVVWYVKSLATKE